MIIIIMRGTFDEKCEKDLIFFWGSSSVSPTRLSVVAFPMEFSLQTLFSPHAHTTSTLLRAECVCGVHMCSVCMREEYV